MSCAKGLRYGHIPAKSRVLSLVIDSVALLGLKLEQPVLLGTSAHIPLVSLPGLWLPLAAMQLLRSLSLIVVSALSEPRLPPAANLLAIFKDVRDANLITKRGIPGGIMRNRRAAGMRF